jgi:hypothetical protein
VAFRLPAFNLTANIWRVNGVARTYAAPDVITLCNLSQGRRVLAPVAKAAGVPAPYYPSELLLPPLTDVRGFWNGVNQDVIEVPAGSKRFYSVIQVDDVAKGFANEYRLALMLYQVAGNSNLIGGPYPAPVPLP